MAGDAARNLSTAELVASGRWKLLREQHDLPAGRKEILGKVGEILESGRVQKLVIQVGEPIKVERLAPRTEDEPSEPIELPEDDYVLAARNAVMEELGDEIDDALEALLEAYELLSNRGATATAIVFHSPKDFLAWMGREEVPKTVFGAKIRFHPEIPDDVALLCGTTSPNDPFSTVTHSVRIPFEIREGTS